MCDLPLIIFIHEAIVHIDNIDIEMKSNDVMLGFATRLYFQKAYILSTP